MHRTIFIVIVVIQMFASIQISSQKENIFDKDKISSGNRYSKSISVISPLQRSENFAGATARSEDFCPRVQNSKLGAKIPRNFVLPKADFGAKWKAY